MKGVPVMIRTHMYIQNGFLFSLLSLCSGCSYLPMKSLFTLEFASMGVGEGAQLHGRRL